MILDMCAEPNVLKVMRIVKTVITFIKIMVPILLLVSASMTFMKAVADGEKNKAVQALIRKIVAAAAIFLIPTFVGIIFKLVDQDKVYYACLENATKEGINAAYAEQVEYYIINAKSTLVESTYYAARSVVDEMDDSPEKQKYEKELEQIKKDVVAANKERREKKMEASKPSTGISTTGEYTPVEAMDMEEAKVKAMSKQECMDYVASMARDIYFKNGGVLPSITVAQAVLESGYCKHFINGTHNLYGLRGYPGNKPKVYGSKNYLRGFDNFYEATYYHYKYFENYRNVYANFLNDCANHRALEAASYLHAYAGGSKTYGPTIQQLIRQYNLTKYDY